MPSARNRILLSHTSETTLLVQSYQKLILPVLASRLQKNPNSEYITIATAVLWNYAGEILLPVANQPIPRYRHLKALMPLPCVNQQACTLFFWQNTWTKIWNRHLKISPAMISMPIRFRPKYNLEVIDTLNEDQHSQRNQLYIGRPDLMFLQKLWWI